MTSPISAANDFLRKHGMHPDDVDMLAELPKLRKNMESALINGATPHDCQMLPAFVSIGTPPVPGERILALDIGGTNLRAALVSFSVDGTPEVENLISRSLPGLENPLTWEEFLAEIVLFSAPLARRACHLGVCFSYQAQITPERDGIVHFFGKEVEITGSYGKLVCRELLDAFSNHGITTLRSYALVNDTVAAMLGGFAQYKGAYDGVLGFILGTGTNLCYQADSKSIPKLPSFWSSDSMVINTESGAYNGFPRGTFDLLVDNTTLSPGIHLAEKMLGGVYQGTILLQLLRAASSEGLFSQEFSNKICEVNKLSSIDLSEFLLQPVGSGLLAQLCFSDHDRQLLSVFINRLLERTAKLVAITLAAPMEAEEMGKRAPALIVAEGSTFWKNDTLRSMILHQSNQLISQKLGRHFAFFEAENPNLVGAALAVFQ